MLSVYKLKSAFNKHPLVATINNDIKANSGVAALAGFLKTFGDAQPSFVPGIMSEALSQSTSWAENEISEHDADYYIENRALQQQLLTSIDGYLDDFRTFETSNDETGGQLMAKAIATDRVNNFPSLLAQVFEVQAAGKACLQQFAQVMPESASQELWSLYGQTYEEPESSSETFAAYISQERIEPEVAISITSLLLYTPPDEQDAVDYTEEFAVALLADDAVFEADGLRSGDNTAFEQSLMSLTSSYAPVAGVTEFLVQWSGTEDWVETNASNSVRLNIIYESDPEPFLEEMLTGAPEAIDATIVSIDGLSVGEYADQATGSGLNVGTTLSQMAQSNISDEISLAEHHLYGSSHLGIQYYDAVNSPIQPGISFLANYATGVGSSPLNTAIPWYSQSYGDLIAAGQKTAWGNGDFTQNWGRTRMLGMKHYSLSDHLGNVLATVLDRKVGNLPNGATTYNYWKADVASATDYYPFGMVMPGRLVNGNKVRFGFNGQEKVNEISGVGNHNTALFWEYDTRLGRRWNLDPKPQVNISDYAAFRNNPIFNNDILGDQATGFDARNNAMRRLLAEGKITNEQYQNFIRDNAIGGAIGGAALLTLYTGGRALPLLQRVGAWALMNQQTVAAIGGLTASLLDPDPGSTVDYPGGFDDIARGVKLLFKNTQGAERFIFNTNRLNFFFGRGTGTQRNIEKSLKRASDFMEMGINETKEGFDMLTKYADQALEAPAMKDAVLNKMSGKYEVWKTVDVVEGGKKKGTIQFGFAYPDKDMKGTPELMTAIPMPSK